MPEILALISHYTDRPDMFLTEVERHDPGFIKRMNASLKARSEKFRESRYNFGHRQAYASLALRIIAALAFIFLIGVAVYEANGFWTIIALVIAYSVSQGGPGGFLKIQGQALGVDDTAMHPD